MAEGIGSVQMMGIKPGLNGDIGCDFRICYFLYFCYLLFVICYLYICYLLFVICYLLFVICYFDIINYGGYALII